MIEIRSFRRQDQQRVRDLIQQGLGEHFGWIDETANPDLDDIAATYGDEVFLVAWRGDELVGTGALVREAEGVGRIVRMSVAGEYQRRGIGTRILDRLIEAARDRDYRRVVLETTETWDEVIAFYTRYGFGLVEHRDGDAHFVLELGKA